LDFYEVNENNHSALKLASPYPVIWKMLKKKEKVYLDKKIFKHLREEEELKRRPISQMSINNYRGRFNLGRIEQHQNKENFEHLRTSQTPKEFNELKATNVNV
jgi:hypothetical protein